MHIIRFVLPSRNHVLKKLSLLYLEAVDKVDANGKLKPEMILVWYVVVVVVVVVVFVFRLNAYIIFVGIFLKNAILLFSRNTTFSHK